MPDKPKPQTKPSHVRARGEFPAQVVTPPRQKPKVGVGVAPAPRAPSNPVDSMPTLAVSEEHQWRDELTQGLVDELVGAARIGGFKRSTAIACGVRPELLEWWLDEGMRPEAPPLQQQLSARFLSCQEGNNLRLLEVVQRCALSGDWEAALALLKHRDPLWRASEKYVERDNAPPELSQAARYAMLVEQMKRPEGELKRALVEAGRLQPDQEESPALVGPQKETE